MTIRTPALAALLALALLAVGCSTQAEGPSPSPTAQARAQRSIGSPPLDLLPGVDMSSLNPEQQSQAMKIFHENGCGCGCGMNIVDCRTKDPNCGRSPVLAARVVQLLAEGKSPEEAAKAVFAPGAAAPSPAAPAAAAGAQKEMVFPVSAGDTFFTGPADAAVTLVTFLDYQ